MADGKQQRKGSMARGMISIEPRFRAQRSAVTGDYVWGDRPKMGKVLIAAKGTKTLPIHHPGR